MTRKLLTSCHLPISLPAMSSTSLRVLGMMPTYPLRLLRLLLPFGKVAHTLVSLTNSLEYWKMFR